MVGRFPVLSETFVLNQLTGLIDQGFEVEIFAECPGEEGRSHPDVDSYNLIEKTRYRPQIPVGRLARAQNAFATLSRMSKKELLPAFKTLNLFRYGRESFSLRLFYESLSFLPCPSFDTVLCHFGQIGLKAVRLREAGVIKGRIATVFHGYDMTMIPKLYGERFYEQLFSLGDLFLPISEYWKNRLVEMGCDPKKIVVHRMGVDIESFPFHSRSITADHTFKIVTIARLVEKKGVEYGVRAVAQLLSEYPQISYDIVGDGPLMGSLQGLVTELGVSDRIRFLGWKNSDEIEELLGAAHALLAPSVTAENGDQEGIPVALMEAMAVGVPVISTFHTGIPELIDNEVSGFLVPERDVDLLKLRISSLIEHPEKSMEFAIAARNKIEAEFDIKKLNSQLLNILGVDLK
jgi:colanic acid/amylovoran biosynthesis glycosyltransferase